MVSIRHKLNGEYVNVAHKMADEGLGLEWHPFPARPKVLDMIPRGEGRAFAELTKSFGDHSMPALPQLDTCIVNRELDRLTKHFETSPS